MVEVIITLAIVGILTVLVMVRYGAFNSAVLLKNQAYEIALAIRGQQVASTGVRGEAGATDNFRQEYGIFITAMQPTQYIEWRDAQAPGDFGDRFYLSATDDTLATQPLDNRFVVTGVCFDETIDPCVNIDGASISFTRPNYDAYIYNYAGLSRESVAVIALQATNDPSVTRRVIVRSTGQISVE